MSLTQSIYIPPVERSNTDGLMPRCGSSVNFTSCRATALMRFICVSCSSSVCFMWRPSLRFTLTHGVRHWAVGAALPWLLRVQLLGQ